MATGRLKALYKQAGEDTFLSRNAIKRFGTPEGKLFCEMGSTRK